MNFPKIAASILFSLLFVAPVAVCQTTVDQSPKTDRRLRVPDWVPIYPGTSPGQISSRGAGIERYFNFQMRTRDSCHKVVDWYENKLHAAGYNTFARFSYDSPACDDGFQSDGPGRTRSIMVGATENPAMNVVIISIQAVERSIGNAAKATVPNWVPIYPGTTPGHMQARKSHDEYHLAFSFTSRDDPNKVYSWYKTKLEAKGFRVRYDITPRSGGLVSNNSDNTRTFNMRNYPGPSENTFTVELMERPAQ